MMDSAADDGHCPGCEDQMKPRDLTARHAGLWGSTRTSLPYRHHRKLPYQFRFRQIQSWMTGCIRYHEECRWSEASPQLPTRVLDLSLHDGTADIRLMNGHGKHGTYVALTYRWGPSPEAIFQTTSTNLQQNQSRIDISSPSFNHIFRDAISIVRSLGFRYLWIDALCIIQDDRSDWLAEASKMATVYSNAFVTISAAVSTSPDDRLVSHADFIYPSRGPQDMFDEVNSGTLAARGWCLQERCLSRRIIHFGKDQIYWECRRATHSEHLLRPELEEGHVLEPSARILLGPLAFRSLRWTEGGPYHHWYRVMNDYTRRHLTQESDSLPALLGLINAFMAATGDRMQLSSGSWRGDMAFGLLWSRQPAGRVRGNKREIGNEKDPTTPSWSWLSVPGEVRWPRDGDAEVREQVLAITALSLDGPTMSITIRGKLLGPSELNNIVRKKHSTSRSVYYSWDFVGPDEQMGRSGDPGYAREQLEDVYVLLVVEPGSLYIDGMEGHGLALAKTNESPESYCRVGYAELPDQAHHAYQPPIHALPLRTIRLESGVGFDGIFKWTPIDSGSRRPERRW